MNKRRAGLYVCMLATSACVDETDTADAAPEVPAEVGETSDAFATTGDVVCEPSSNPYRRSDFGEDPCWLGLGTYGVAAATSSTHPNRYVIGERVNTANDFFYSVVDGASTPLKFMSNFATCNGSPCKASSHGVVATTLRPGALTTTRRDAVFITGQQYLGIGGTVQHGGDTEIWGIRIKADGTVAGTQRLWKSWVPFLDETLVAGESLRKAADSRDQAVGIGGTENPVLVAFHDTSYPEDWHISALLWRPSSGDVTYPPSVSACSTSTCERGHSYLPVIDVAYSRVADKFLAVSVFRSASNQQVFVRGQIYDGTTGALGPTIDFQEPYEYATHGLGVGVASNPDSGVNPSGNWTVFAGLRRFTVKPSGSYSAAYISPPPDSVAALTTLHHVSSTTDPYAYEVLYDHMAEAPLAAERHWTSHSSGKRFAIDAAEPKGCAEGLAHGTNNMSLAVWSQKYYNEDKKAWEDGLCRRLVDH